VAVRAVGEGGEVGPAVYLHLDHLGSPVVATDGEGDVVGEVRYLPYGGIRVQVGEMPTALGFTGQRWDANVGLLYYRARYYDPGLGRFTKPDTVVPGAGTPQKLNRYSYVQNNPLRFTDPTGHREIEEGPDVPPPPPPPPLPPGRYYRTENYGWFDSKHLNTGKPSKIIQDVKTAIAAGGGIVPVEQPIRMGIFSSTFRGKYMVSGEATEEQAIGIALGIYEDWSIRFEAWEGSFPGPIGDDTSFAIEDLPTHYVGFYAAATGNDPATVFWNYLGGVEGTNQEPPRGVKNGEFMPMVQGEGGKWVHVPWPEAMTITPVPMGPDTWWPINVGCYFLCWGSSPPNAKDVNTLKPK